MAAAVSTGRFQAAWRLRTERKVSQRHQTEPGASRSLTALLRRHGLLQQLLTLARPHVSTRRLGRKKNTGVDEGVDKGVDKGVDQPVPSLSTFEGGGGDGAASPSLPG